MKENQLRVYVTPETHWDREWYLPFNEYRARLVTLIDRLLNIYDSDAKYLNFTMDGQSIPIEDYLEVRPQEKARIGQAVKSGRLSLGPLYILPDEYLISGESFIRNFLLGIKIAEKYGGYMKAAYIPDPFGHIAQLPQLVAGFDLGGVLFARGFGNQFEEHDLDIEFIWKAPGGASETLAIFLKEGYGSVANLSEEKEDGRYRFAIKRIETVVERLKKDSVASALILNNGSDHLLAQEFLPELIEQYNAEHEDKLIQADFEQYITDILDQNLDLKEYTGELHGGKYLPILSGVFSARMWIKQENYDCQTLLERYTEPFSALAWLLAKDQKFSYSSEYIWHAWSLLLQNHPHDSICGCSIDEVHDIDMKARFYNSFVIGSELRKEAMNSLAYQIDWDDLEEERIPIIVFNPLPWDRTNIVDVIVTFTENMRFTEEDLRLVDHEDNVVAFEIKDHELKPRYRNVSIFACKLKFQASCPAFGYKVFYIYPFEEPETFSSALVAAERTIENALAKLEFNEDGTFTYFNKETGKQYQKQGILEDCGDWGDEYDFSWPDPKRGQEDRVIQSVGTKASIETTQSALTASALVELSLDLPASLTNDSNRTRRTEQTIESQFQIQYELRKDDPVVYIKILHENRCKDHRLRILFPTGIVADIVDADGHFYVVPRSVHPPDHKDWHQTWQSTHHQHKFVSVSDGEHALTILNKGLPEYDTIVEKDNSITIGITLLRCVGWLSRPDFASRSGNAGPDLHTPGAQCLGKHTFELGLIGSAQNWEQAQIYKIAECYHAPITPFSPFGYNSSSRMDNAFFLHGSMGAGDIKYTHTKQLPPTSGLCRLEGENITMTALKKAERAEALIIRLCNMGTKKNTGILTLSRKIQNCTLVNLNEIPISDSKAAELKWDQDKIEITIASHAIITLQLQL